MKRAQLKPKEERRLLRGHLWAYRNEFDSLPALADGELVDVYAEHGRFIGRGFYQAQGGIAVRLLSRHQEEVGPVFFHRRIEDAGRFRERFFPGESAYRWVFGESDGLPGLMADRYGAVVCVQTHCKFYMSHVDRLAQVFMAEEGVSGVQVDVGGDVRRFGAVENPVVVQLEDLSLAVDIEGGQKTGMFLDQRVNCRVMAQLAPGARVLDAHCYIGLWSCMAAKCGAAQVVGVDTSRSAIERATRNAESNGFGSVCSFECADAAKVLQADGRYDVVLLDPPALAKSSAQAKKALGLYHVLNRDAMKRVTPGGYLVTSCCSHAVDRAAFLEVLKRAARAAQREALLVDLRGASPDHPVLLAMPETEYLTCAVLRILA